MESRKNFWPEVGLPYVLGTHFDALTQRHLPWVPRI